ncbi:hypothetical protein BSKO_09254 [Bryopsis sp. KO-2023]|nr:hypothetical protein BSKO_09254 [Bryopsis sp. KO-2023]
MSETDGGNAQKSSTCEGKCLATVFEEGLSEIKTKRSENIFKQLDSRKLTDEESEIIRKRVELQQKMLEAYENRERQRKGNELRMICPDLTNDEAMAALEFCNGREEEAALLLSSDPSFRENLRSKEDEGNSSKTPAQRTRNKRSETTARPARAQGKVNVESSDGVYVGRFQSRLGPYQLARFNPNKEARKTEGAAERMVVDDSEEEGNMDLDCGDRDSENADSLSWGSKKARSKKKRDQGNAFNAAPSTPVARGSQSGSEETVSDGGASEEDSPNSGWKGKKKRSNNRKGSPMSEEKRKSLLDSIGVAEKTKEQKTDAGKARPSAIDDDEARSLPLTARSLPLKSAAPQTDCTDKEDEEEEDNEEVTDVEDDDKRRSRIDDLKILSPKENRQPMEDNCGKNEDNGGRATRGKLGALARGGNGTKAISSRGHTCRGRVRQKAQKKVELVELGALKPADGWFNAGYIFPEGFKARTGFRSSVSLDSTCIHMCEIVGKGGAYYPNPTFVVTAYDRPDEPLIAKSCTGCWSAVLKRINSEITRRIKLGENLPPPPKTAIAGPEYFGLIQADIVERIETLDPEQLCETYWCGKEDRKVAKANLGSRSKGGAAKQNAKVGKITENSTSYMTTRKRERRNRMPAASASDDGRESEGDDPELDYTRDKWSSLGRRERYKRRCANRGGEEEEDHENDDNPLQNFIDPITLEPVVGPAISPYGHVMGMATWKAVLSDQRRCPFTKQPLSWEQCTMLTQTNIDKYHDRIVQL